VSEICQICGRSHPNERLPMSNAEHRPDCLFVRDGGRSICTCWPETQIEREQLKQTTMNDLGSILGRCEIRLQHIENKIDDLGEAREKDFHAHATNSDAQYNELRTTLNVICEHQLKIEERMK
jgi:hypothetical protein